MSEAISRYTIKAVDRIKNRKCIDALTTNN